MTYSKTHQKFSDYLKQPDALTNPGKYLGPNWEDVLNFWIYIDTLNEQEREEIADRYWALDENVRDSAIDAACDAAAEVVGRKFIDSAWLAARDVTRWLDVFGCATGRWVFGDVTVELIGSHKILEQNKTPLFLSLIVKQTLIKLAH